MAAKRNYVTNRIAVVLVIVVAVVVVLGIIITSSNIEKVIPVQAVEALRVARG
jgi:hypothetical protein